MSRSTAERFDVDRAGLVAALRRVLPAEAVLDHAEDLRPYECDGLSAYRQLPLAVALPRDADEVAAVLAACREFGAPVVARGAGTSLSGGALPHRDGVVLSLARLNRILAIDPANRTARVQPGVRNLAISEMAKGYGLYYAPDPSSQITCSIGGNVAENAGGVHCLKYGLTVHNIVQVELLTVDGERLTFGTDGPDAPGYDLLALLIGSEGMLGVVTEITVKLLPLPACAKVVLGAFDAVGDAGDAVSRIIAAGIIPGGLEMMDGPAIKAAEDFVHAGYPVDAQAILLCELDGTVAEVDAQIDQVREIMQACRAREV
ncbi:MAG TPA: FAD-binding protein, partial [Gammaproteobacteria bacterium]